MAAAFPSLRSLFPCSPQLFPLRAPAAGHSGEYRSMQRRILDDPPLDLCSLHGRRAQWFQASGQAMSHSATGLRRPSLPRFDDSGPVWGTEGLRQRETMTGITPIDQGGRRRAMASQEETPQGLVSVRVEVPQPLQEAMRSFIERHPNWDQYRLIQASLAGFLMQNGIEDRGVTRCFLANLFPAGGRFAPLSPPQSRLESTQAIARPCPRQPFHPAA